MRRQMVTTMYNKISYLQAEYYLICRLRAKCVISESIVNSVPCDGVFVLTYFLQNNG